jgi:hypothetical protein
MCMPIDSAHAGELRINTVSIPQEAPLYPSLEDAAAAAVKALRAEKRLAEFGGVIVRNDDGTYQVSNLVTSLDETRLGMGIPMSIRKKLAATFHSHPSVARAHGGKLSKDDKAAIKQLGVPMYVWDARNQRVIIGQPGQHKH